jgi:uncharacterized damage-inducible protein DinB
VPEDRDALLQHYRTMRADLLTAIEGLTDEQLSEATLDGWSVKDHLAHLAAWDDIRGSEVERISAGHDSAWRLAPGRDEDQSALFHDARHGLSVTQARWELETSRQRLLDAIDAATERALEPDRYGEAALRSTHEAQHTGWIRRWRTEQGY